MAVLLFYSSLVGSSAYWSGEEYASSPSYAWLFYMGLGELANYRIDRNALGLAVHSGQVLEISVHPADLDNDNDVDGTDLAKMAQLFSDGDVSADDLEAFADAFGRIYYPS